MLLHLARRQVSCTQRWLGSHHHVVLLSWFSLTGRVPHLFWGLFLFLTHMRLEFQDVASSHVRGHLISISALLYNRSTCVLLLRCKLEISGRDIVTRTLVTSLRFMLLFIRQVLTWDRRQLLSGACSFHLPSLHRRHPHPSCVLLCSCCCSTSSRWGSLLALCFSVRVALGCLGASFCWRPALARSLRHLACLWSSSRTLPARAGVYAPGLAYCASQLRSVLAALSLLSAGLLFTMGCLFLFVMAHYFAVAGLVFPPVSPPFFVLRGTGLVLPPVSSRVSASPAVVYAPGLAYCASQLRSVLAALVLPFGLSLALRIYCWAILSRCASLHCALSTFSFCHVLQHPLGFLISGMAVV